MSFIIAILIAILIIVLDIIIMIKFIQNINKKNMSDFEKMIIKIVIFLLDIPITLSLSIMTITIGSMISIL